MLAHGQELEDADQAGPRKHALPGYMTETPAQVLQQFALHFVAGREVCMAGFGRKRKVSGRVAHGEPDAQPAAGCDHQPRRTWHSAAGLQPRQLRRRELANAMGGGLYVVQQPNRGQPQLLRELARIDIPGQVGHPAMQSVGGSGHGQCRACEIAAGRPHLGRCHESGKNFGQRHIVGIAIHRLVHQRMGGDRFGQYTGVGRADIGGQDQTFGHRCRFLLRLGFVLPVSLMRQATASKAIRSLYSCRPL